LARALLAGVARAVPRAWPAGAGEGADGPQVAGDALVAAALGWVEQPVAVVVVAVAQLGFGQVKAAAGRRPDVLAGRAGQARLGAGAAASSAVPRVAQRGRGEPAGVAASRRLGARARAALVDQPVAVVVDAVARLAGAAVERVA